MRKGILLVVGLVAVLLAVVIGRTVLLAPAAERGGTAASRIVEVDVDAAAARLAEGLRFETISFSRDHPVPDAFLALHAHLARSYPRVHQSLERELVSEYSLLYRWPGRDPAKKPVLLMAHQDVVPVDEASWQHPPFGGEIVDGVLWGRGAIDDKGALYAILEAVELLLAQGFEPEGDVYLFFGHDEELGGPRGAEVAGKLMEERGLELGWVTDEGGFVVSGLIPGAENPMAFVGIAEKGSVTFALTVDGTGGHSSVPPRQGNIGVLAQAISRLEANPVPGGIDPLGEEFLLSLAPELPFGIRAVLANLWLFRPLAEAAMSRSPTMDAMLRTTTAVTIIHGGVKSNVLPSHVEAMVNFRIKPGDSAESVEAHIVRTVADERVKVRRAGDVYREASPVSPTDSAAFAHLAGAIRQSFPDVAVVPYTVVGGTDSRNFYGVTKNVYRFNPFRFDPKSIRWVHGTDERMEVAQLAAAVDFYARLIVGPRAKAD